MKSVSRAPILNAELYAKAAIVFALSTTTSCSGTRGPEDFGLAYEAVSRVEADCRSMEGPTPEQYTQAFFRENLNRYGVSQRPNPLGCVWGAFNDAELATFAQAGDPVAMLSIVVKKNRFEKSLCSDFQKVEEELWKAFRQERFAGDLRAISRVPEAPYFIALIAQECEIDRAELSMDSIDYGYDPSFELILVD